MNKFKIIFLYIFLVTIINCTLKTNKSLQAELKLLSVLPPLDLSGLFANSGTSGGSSTSSNTVSYTWGSLTDNLNGTILFVGTGDYSGIKLVFKKCSQGQTWDNLNNTCTGTALRYYYCSSNDQSCNDSTSGNLNGTGTSQAYTSCNSEGTFGGYSGWRVPTIDELKTIINCDDKKMPIGGSTCNTYTPPVVDSTLFPNTVTYGYWSATTNQSSPSLAWYIEFSRGNILSYGTKTQQLFLRCVTSL